MSVLGRSRPMVERLRRTEAASFGILLAAVLLLAVVPDARLAGGLALIATIAYLNGANDISKSVATLVGSGIASYRRAVLYGAAMTVLGAAASGVVGAGLVATFSTRLLAEETTVVFPFVLAAIVGAVGWVALATTRGLPVSTTHALTGSIVVAASLVFGWETVRWSLLGLIVVLPLLISPVLGALLGLAVRSAAGATRLGGSARLGAAHWLASGMTAVARGLNDAPKLAGLSVLLLLAIDGHAPSPAAGTSVAAMIGVAMGLGSLAGGRRVIETLAGRITTLTDLDGASSNIATATLVTLAAANGLPASTTQVSGGSIVGIGLLARDHRVDLHVVREIGLAWLVTAPGAGLIAALTYLLFAALSG